MDIITEYYDALISLSYEEYELYKSVCQGKILEIGCGTGQLLIPLIAEGYDVTGIDKDKEALDICLHKARKHQYNPQLYHQSMEMLDLNEQFDTILIPSGIFGLLCDPKNRDTTLHRLYAHLKSQGRLVITLYSPSIDDICMNGIECLYTAVKTDDVHISWFVRCEYDLYSCTRTALYRFVINYAHEIKQTLSWRFYSENELSMILDKNNFSCIETFNHHGLYFYVLTKY